MVIKYKSDVYNYIASRFDGIYNICLNVKCCSIHNFCSCGRFFFRIDILISNLSDLSPVACVFFKDNELCCYFDFRKKSNFYNIKIIEYAEGFIPNVNEIESDFLGL